MILGLVTPASLVATHRGCFFPSKALGEWPKHHLETDHWHAGHTNVRGTV